MKRVLLTFAAAFVTIFCGGARAQPMNFTFLAFPDNAVKTIVLATETGDVIIASGSARRADVDVAKIPWVERTVAAIWDNESVAGYPIRLSVAFRGKPVEVHFHKSANVKDLPLDCAERTATITREKFRFVHECRSAAMSLRDPDNIYSPKHLKTLTGWFLAAYSLYNQDPPAPYGLDPELLKNVKEVIAKVDSEGYAERKFLPFRVADARKLVSLVDDEDVRLASHVKILAESRRWDDAKILNDFVTKRFSELAGERRVSVIRGVTKELLEANDRWIKAKQAP